MQLEQAIMKRRSVRKYLSKQVDDATIKQLLQSAMAAPSACNKQPWEFFVVKNADVLQKLSHSARFANYNAPLMIVVCSNKDRQLSQKDNDFFIQDCSAAIQNMLLTATDLGLGSCWCGVYPLETAVKRVKDALSLADNITPLSIVLFGYADEFPPERTQYNEEYVHFVE